MAQTGFTPIQLYRTSTASAVPSAGNLADGELAINTTDKKLYAKDNTGTVFLLASADGTSGTVQSVSVVSANGLAGTVANATTTPAITLSTSVTGVLKGNGTAISAATAGTDYLAPPSGTALLKANSGSALANAVAGTDYVAPGGALGTPSSGTLSSCTVDGTNPVGFLNIPQNSQSANYTTVLSDSGKCIFHPASDANERTFTIASNASVAYPIGSVIQFCNFTSQVLTIAINSDTMFLAGTGSTGSRSLAQYGIANAMKVGATTWIVTGSGLS